MPDSLNLAVFDIDGTIVDSRATIAAAMDEAFVACGLAPPGYDATRTIVGLSLQPAIARLAPGLTPARWQDIQDAYVAAFVRLRAGQKLGCDPLYDGAGALLRRLKAEGWLLGVATGKSRRGLAAIFAGHGLHDVFDAVHCADDGPGKPDPFMLECNLKTLGAERAHAIMIGDTSHDMEMACAAGVHAQGVAWGFHTAEEVAAGGAVHVARDFAELEGALCAFAAR